MAGMRIRPIIGAAVGSTMMLVSTTAIAAPASAPQFDPWAVLSVMNGGASSAAVCGAAAATAAAVQNPPGCVLPQLDTPPAAPQPGPPAAVPAAAYVPSTVLPIPVILIWGAVLAAMVYMASEHHNHFAPNSPV